MTGLPSLARDAASRARLGKPDSYRVRYVEKQATPFERFFTRFAQNRIAARWMADTSLGQALLAHAMPQVRADFRFLDSALQATHGTPVKALAYCFCGF